MNTEVKEDEKVMRLDEIADYLRVGKRTLQSWRASGKLPAPDLNIGSTLRWRRQTIDSWLYDLAGR